MLEIQTFLIHPPGMPMPVYSFRPHDDYPAKVVFSYMCLAKRNLSGRIIHFSMSINLCSKEDESDVHVGEVGACFQKNELFSFLSGPIEILFPYAGMFDLYVNLKSADNLFVGKPFKYSVQCLGEEAPTFNSPSPDFEGGMN